MTTANTWSQGQFLLADPNNWIWQKKSNLKFTLIFPSNSSIFIDSLKSSFNKNWHSIGYNELKYSEINSDWCLILGNNEELKPYALNIFCEFIKKNSKQDIFYYDHELENKGKTSLLFKVPFDLEYFKSLDYIGPSFFIKSSLLKRWKLEKDISSYCFRGLVNLLKSENEKLIGHIPEVLTRIKSSNYFSYLNENRSLRIETLKELLDQGSTSINISEGLTKESFKVIYKHQEKPLVSILIPTKNKLKFLKRCIKSILQKTSYHNYEIIILDNQSDEAECLDYIQKICQQNPTIIKSYKYNKEFNFSAINNFGVKKASGQYILLLNNDTRVLNNDWLEQMMSEAQRDDVGIVGPLLFFGNNTIQHAGVLLGLRGSCAHPFLKQNYDKNSYFQRLTVPQSLPAVTAACLLIKKDLYQSLNGMDKTNYKVDYSDIDLCLKVREKGLKVIFTPYAKLTHYERQSIGVNIDKERAVVLTNDRQNFVRKWKKQILSLPSYNKNLSLSNTDFSPGRQRLLNWDYLGPNKFKVWIQSHPNNKRINQMAEIIGDGEKFFAQRSFEILAETEIAILNPNIWIGCLIPNLSLLLLYMKVVNEFSTAKIFIDISNAINKENNTLLNDFYRQLSTLVNGIIVENNSQKNEVKKFFSKVLVIPNNNLNSIKDFIS